MTLPLLPADLDLVGVTEDELDDATEMAIVQGQSYELDFQVEDADGDPFDLGPTATPEWDVAAELRSDFLDSDETADAAFAVSFTDGPNGRFTLSLTPTQTAALTESAATGNPRWDLFITNKSAGGNPSYTAGFAQMLARGRWGLLLRATDA